MLLINIPEMEKVLKWIRAICVCASRVLNFNHPELFLQEKKVERKQKKVANCVHLNLTPLLSGGKCLFLSGTKSCFHETDRGYRQAAPSHREKLWVKKSRNKLDTILVQVFTQVVFLQRRDILYQALIAKKHAPKVVISGPPKTNKSFDKGQMRGQWCDESKACWSFQINSIDFPSWPKKLICLSYYLGSIKGYL